MAKYVFLSHVSEEPHKLIRLAQKDPGPINYVFFAQDYLQYLRWQKIIPEKYKRVITKSDLEEIFAKLRNPFNDLMGHLGQKYDSPAWWTSRISEKNTMVSHLFLYCCYLKAFVDSFSKTKDSLCVIAEDWALLESIAEVARMQNSEICWVSRRPWLFQQILFWAKAVERIFKTLFRSFFAYLAGSCFDSDQEREKKKILIRTYIDEGCFSKEGKFRDRYFPGLAEWLSKEGFTVVILPVLFNFKDGYDQVWQKLRQNNFKFINPYRYYHMSDYYFILCESWRQRGFFNEEIVFEEMNISRLFCAERDRFLFGTMESLLYTRLPKRLTEQGINFQQLTDSFENMIDEKALILGFRNYSPATKIAGFQHSTIYPNLLCQIFTEAESEIAPLPDRIVCNGEFFKNVMNSSKFPSNRLMVGAALRYGYLQDLAADEKSIKRCEGDILIPLSLKISDAVEIVSKAAEAFFDLPHLKVKLKLHPMMSKNYFLKSMGESRIPLNFEFVDGMIFDWLLKVKVVVAMGSAVILETLAAGVPIVVVGSENALDFNPLGFFSGMGKSFFSPLEIRNEALRLLSLSEQERLKYVINGEEIRRACFHPVSDEAMRSFILQ